MRLLSHAAACRNDPEIADRIPADSVRIEIRLKQARSAPITFVDPHEVVHRFENEQALEDWLHLTGTDQRLAHWDRFVTERDFSITEGLAQLPADHPDVVAYLASLDAETSTTRGFFSLYDATNCSHHLSTTWGVPIPRMVKSKRNRISSVKPRVGLDLILFNKTWFRGSRIWITPLAAGGTSCRDLSSSGWNFNNKTESYGSF
ncbi:MAG: hypothetical protein V3V08_18400 [Nannocystaceae bacterium]